MKIKVISDLHGQLPTRIGEDCDLLLIAGDVCPLNRAVDSHKQQADWARSKLKEWLLNLELKGTRVVITPGNHDFCFRSKKVLRVLPSDVLIDEEVIVNGIRIYGTPWTPLFMNWAYMKTEEELREVFEGIPAGLDILLSHGPPYGVCDRVNHIADPLGRCLGSEALREAILEKEPRNAFFGHIHTGLHSDVILGKTRCRNVSLLNEQYETTEKPLEIEL